MSLKRRFRHGLQNNEGLLGCFAPRKMLSVGWLTSIVLLSFTAQASLAAADEQGAQYALYQLLNSDCAVSAKEDRILARVKAFGGQLDPTLIEIFQSSISFQEGPRLQAVRKSLEEQWTIRQSYLDRKTLKLTDAERQLLNRVTKQTYIDQRLRQVRLRYAKRSVKGIRVIGSPKGKEVLTTFLETTKGKEGFEAVEVVTDDKINLSGRELAELRLVIKDALKRFRPGTGESRN